MNLSELHAVARSLKRAFGDQIMVELLESEIKISLSGKTVWVGRSGELTGETSGVGPAALPVGIDAISASITSSGAAVKASV